MSKPKMFEKPVGVKDYLPDAVSKLKYIEKNVLACMQKWGYRQIVTPTLEYYDTVGAASSTIDKRLFKLLDRKGTTVVLRSDMTAPIARVVASLLKDEPFPLRLSYHSNVFRAIEEEAGREAEYFQTGVELVGDASPEADAEVVALAVACLQAAGVKEFKVALGHIGFLDGLFRETLQERFEEQEALKDCLLKRDHVGYRHLLKRFALPEAVQEELTGILRLRGGQEICRQARTLTKDPMARSSLEQLCEVWDILQHYGVGEHVLIDLTNIGDFSYYTGITFEGYSADLGFPVCSGGRYDNLLSQFGRPAPATGFALKTNRILEVAGIETPHEPARILILYRTEMRREALRRAVQLRSHSDEIVETKLVGEEERIRVDWEGHGASDYNGRRYDEIIRFI